MDQETSFQPPIKRKLLGITITKKKIIWTAIIVLVVGFVGYRIFKPKDNSANIQTAIVKKQNIKATVLATGQVVSGTDLDLSFQSSGFVRNISVKEGDKVKAGQTLSTLDQSSQLAALTSANGALASAQANYNKVLAGASSQDVAVAQTTLDSAKASLSSTISQQQVLVDNAYKALLNSGLSAIPSTGNVGSVTATISGAYTAKDQGVYNITIFSTGSGSRFQFSGLETGTGIADITPQSLGQNGLYIQFSSTSVPANNTWTITIPNTQAATYVANYNAYQSSLQTQSSSVSAAQNAVTTAQAALDLKKAQARPADVEAAQAQILSAQGQVQSAQAQLANTIIRSPSDGTITSVDVKVGELASASKEVLILQDVTNLHIEADVSEANIAAVQPGQKVDVTFDALGPDRHFTASVLTVDPASTVISGVVDYLVKASIENIPDIKPGMTANMTIQTAEKDNVLAVPSSAVVSQNGQQNARVIDDTKKKTYRQVVVQTGLSADGGLVEITSGLSEGQEIVTFIKQ